MSRNLILAGILGFLLVATYFLQEKRVDKEYVESLARDRVLVAPLTHLKWADVDAQKSGEQWKMGEELLSYNSLKQIEKKILEVKKVKDVEGEWSSFFPHPFVFEVNHEAWTLGEMTLDKQGFYLGIGQKVVVARIEGESHELTQSEEEIEEIKLHELKALLSKNKAELHEVQLFRFYQQIPFERILIQSQDRVSFELNFLNNQTLPNPIEGIDVHENLKAKFLSLLTQVNIRKEIPFKEKLKVHLMGKITFMAQNQTSVEWELWLKDKKSADAIIIDSAQKKAYLMVGGTLKIFFIGIQDYWDKKVIPAKYFKTFTRLPLTLSEGSKSGKVTVLNREPLQFESSMKVDDLNMTELLSFVFNLGQRDQADRVSILSKTERQQVLSEEHLRMEVMGQDILFWRKTEELIVVNLTQGFKAHYGLLSEKFRARFEDVLK